jgi:hypothetical protein
MRPQIERLTRLNDLALLQQIGCVHGRAWLRRAMTPV